MKAFLYEAQIHSHPQSFPAHCGRLSNYAQIKASPHNILLLRLFLQGSFTRNWTPDGLQLCQNVVYCYKSWCSEEAVQRNSVFASEFLPSTRGLLLSGLVNVHLHSYL